MFSDRYLRKIQVQGDRMVLLVVWLMCLNSIALVPAVRSRALAIAAGRR